MTKSESKNLYDTTVNEFFILAAKLKLKKLGKADEEIEKIDTVEEAMTVLNANC
jgi:hypothetical protein